MMRVNLLIILAMLQAAAGAEPERITLYPTDNGQGLKNPGMGWVVHYYDNFLRGFGNYDDPLDTHDYFPGLTVAYLRLAWAYLEPEQGKFNWSIVDGPTQRFADKGMQVAFRISCYEGHSKQFEATPSWVRRAGARGDIIKEEDGQEYWQPRYDDPVFLQHVETFLAAAARRYDGNPNVAWIDVGSFGIWGEGHTKLDYSRDTRRQHVALHTKHSKKTLVAVNDDIGRDRGKPSRLDDLVGTASNVALRDDSILVNPGLRAYRSAFLAEQFWPRNPVILESAHYGGPRAGKFWEDGRLYYESMEAYRGSYISIHWHVREFWDENKDFIRRMNLRMGYRLNLLEAGWPATIPQEGRFDVVSKWKNVGIAPCYPGGFVALTLKSESGGIVAVFVDESWDFRELAVDMPGPGSNVVQFNNGISRDNTTNSVQTIALPVPGSAPVKDLRSAFALNQMVKPGTYQVFISIGARDGTPKLELPLPDSDGHRRYRLGAATVTAR